MASSTLTVRDPRPEELSDQLYRHSRKPEWGLGILAWQRDGRRAYQFEDGRLRKIRKGYYDLLDLVEDPEGKLKGVRSGLRATLKARREGSLERRVLEAVCTFDEQLALFAELYPKGFRDPTWIEEKRGSTSGSALKRHRDPVLAATRDALDPHEAGALVEEARGAELAESLLEILSGTDLVPISHVKVLRRLDEDEAAEYGTIAFRLAHGEAPFDERFRAHLRFLTEALGGRPSWRVATALPALIHPRTEVAVRRSAFIRQAGSIAPTGVYSRKPRVPSYRSFRRMARQVEERLVEAGHEPADLLDVHDFIWTTLRKSALDHL